MTDEEMSPPMRAYMDAARSFKPMRDHLWGLLSRVSSAETVLRALDRGDRADQLAEVQEFLSFVERVVDDASRVVAREAMAAEMGP